LTRDEVLGAIQDFTPQVRRCAAASNPPPGIRMRLQIDGQGRIHLIEVTPTPPLAIETCVRDAVNGVRLRASGQQAFTAEFPLSFTP
jgi:hypothetical protein